ncbi:rhodanese-like domain-containing protein [Streptomyces calidiresistens]|uniref:Rhodanese-like domain-containing protein n=1 Tax=Streptomyces calidiresistens TaxID=1485586 RepID=A0A7W3T7J5_9ACTN|nr:rhodanese-like domain-containing protein [Streptomyces calidiresistens]MBB0232384.1 rhodanese-like domain-containing protein [Streptomyces calidiresistens]
MNFAQVPTVTVDAVPADGLLLDVREPDEWAAGRAEGALHIPMGEVIARLAEIEERAGDEPVHVLCRVGGRSAQVTAYLARNGVDAVNVDGGMLAWEAAGRPMVADGEPPRVL